MSDAAGGRWWHGATLYQVYVRSWRDTNGDGYGDLGGVIAGLDYLQWLGVDGIWLSPTMPSPDEDWGYDVSGYLDVHPELGTLADMDRLIAEAGRRGIRVLLDLVPNHTSSAHPWFADARTGPGSGHRTYYVWADPAADDGPPNNWRSATGESAWEYDPPSGQYYLHNFLPGQPDLNWWEPAVHEEFRKILRFWFDRGVAGFRIDVAHGLYKDARLRDNPPLGDGSRHDGAFGLKAVYSANRPEAHNVFRDWRRAAEAYSPPRLLLGETWVGDVSRIASFYGGDDELQLAFNFPFLFADFTAPALAGVVAETLAGLPARACPTWTASNHDVSRFPTRWCGGNEDRARLGLLLLATLPGTLVLYYGDEIAMTDVAVPTRLRRDRMTQKGLTGVGRDRSRTPMQWDASPSAGFTADGVRPWLPYGDHARRNVAVQRDDPDSTLNLCRSLLALRRAEVGGRIAEYRQVPGPAGVWAYRVGELLVAANLSDRPVALRSLDGAGPLRPGGEAASRDQPGTVLLTTGPVASQAGSPMILGAWHGLITRAGSVSDGLALG
jgi:alpha-glucosidase